MRGSLGFISCNHLGLAIRTSDWLGKLRKHGAISEQADEFGKEIPGKAWYLCYNLQYIYRGPLFLNKATASVRFMGVMFPQTDFFFLVVGRLIALQKSAFAP